MPVSLISAPEPVSSTSHTRDVGVLFLLALCFTWGGINLGHSFLSPSIGLDFTQYYVASRMVVHGQAQEIYRTDRYYFEKATAYGAVVGPQASTSTNAYPPFTAFCFIPLTLLPFKPALLVFNVAGLLAIAVGVWLFFAGKTEANRSVFRLAGLLLTFSFFPIYYSAFMGQVNALLFLCAALVLYFARRKRPGYAGFFIALAALIKIYPAVLMLFFAARREFKPVVAALASMAVLIAVSLPVCPASLYVTYVSQVLPRQVDAGAFFRNQGLGGFFARLLTDNPYVNSLGNWPTLAHGLTLLTGSFVLVAALSVAARRAGDLYTFDLQFGLCLVATLLALSKSWEYYAIMLLFAYLAILKLAAYSRDLPRIPLLLVFLSFCTWTFVLPQDIDYQKLPHSILLQPLFSAKCIATVMLFIACIWFLADSRTRERAG